MITSALAIAPTAPGQPAKGSLPVGGDLFALSMLAAGAEAGPAVVDAPVPLPHADPARQAFAAPGMPMPTPDATTVDPALAWLPAVNIAIPASLDIPPALASVVPAVDTAPLTANRAFPTLRGGASVSVLAATLPTSAAAPAMDVADARLPLAQPVQRRTVIVDAPVADVPVADVPVADVPVAPEGTSDISVEFVVSTPPSIIDERAMPTKAVAIRRANTGARPETDLAPDTSPTSATDPSDHDPVAEATVGAALDATLAPPPELMPPAINPVAPQPVVAAVVPSSETSSVTRSAVPGDLDVMTANRGGTPVARYTGAPAAQMADAPVVGARELPIASDTGPIGARRLDTHDAQPIDVPADSSAAPERDGTIAPVASQPGAAAKPRIDAPAPRQPDTAVTARTDAVAAPKIDVSAAQPVGAPVVHQPNATAASRSDAPTVQPAEPLAVDAADPITGQRLPTSASPKRDAIVAPTTDMSVTPNIDDTRVQRDGAPITAQFVGEPDVIHVDAAAAPIPPAIVADPTVARDTRVAPTTMGRDERLQTAVAIDQPITAPSADPRVASDTQTASPHAVVPESAPSTAPATIARDQVAVVDAIVPPDVPDAPPAQPVAAPLATPTAPANTGAPRARGVAARNDVAPARHVVSDAAAPAAAPAPAAAAPASTSSPVIAAAAPVPATGMTMAPAPAGTSAAADVQPRPAFIREVSGATRQTVALRPQTAAMPQPAAGTTAPAAQVFGAAMHAAANGDERKRTETVEPAITATAAPAQAGSTAPVGDTAQPTLDMRQNTWPTSMIDHIEALRDAANASDTRIRLVPDALGAIDIAVKTVGDAIHIRFAADDATTRTMIEDARPGLIAIAEERGLRIGQAIVEAAPSAQTASQSNGGQSNPNSSNANQQSPQSATPSPNGNGQQSAAQAQAGQQQPRQQQQAATARQPATPASTRTPSNDTDAATTGRIA